MIPESLSYGDVVIRLAVAALAGSVVGVDRELRGKPAGLRTHALVSLGACLIVTTTIAMSLGGTADAVSRAIQGIIAGVGFLGGGTILKSRDRDEISGLTTAASIWFVASLGIACGHGFWLATVTALFLALFILVGGGPFEGMLRRIALNHGADPKKESPEGRD